MENCDNNYIDCPSPSVHHIPQQYPSQSADFISLEVQYTPNNSHHNNRSMNHLWTTNRSKFRNYASPSNGKYGDAHRKRPFNAQHEIRENFKKQFVSNKLVYDFSSYFHFSMLQDPWDNLMMRHQALFYSKISLASD